MTKDVLIEILKRSIWLAGWLAVASLATLLTVRADWVAVVTGTILTPVAGVIIKLLGTYFKHRGNLTVAEVDAAFDAAQEPDTTTGN